MLRRFTFALALALLMAGTATAQQLPALLPGDTFFAVGVQDLAQHEGKLDEVIAEWERLGLTEAFEQLFATVDDAAAQEGLGDTVEEFELPAALQDVELLDIIGQEAYLAVSMSVFNPMPSVIFATLVDPALGSELAATLESEAQANGATTLDEGGTSIYVFVDEDPSVPPMAAAVDGDLLLIASNPETVRASLRLRGGADEPNLAGSEGFANSIGALGPGTTYFYLDFEAVGRGLEQFGAMAPEFEGLINRGIDALSTFGQFGTVMRVEDDGLASEGIQLVGKNDAQLARLITSGTGGVSQEPLAFVTDETLAVTVSSANVAGWWEYIVDFVRRSDELGNPDLNQLVADMVGLDLQSSLFSWMGDEMATLQGDLGEAVQPGQAPDNLLGDSLYMFASTDDTAAREGLTAFFTLAGTMIASFSDPSGVGEAQITAGEVAGTPVTTYEMADGISLTTAVVDGWALIGTSAGMVEDALLAREAGSEAPQQLIGYLNEVPEQATAYALADNSATLEQVGSLYAVQIQTVAGLTGTMVDFDLLQQTMTAIEEFFDFLAGRSGASYSYSTSEGGVIRSESFTEFNW